MSPTDCFSCFLGRSFAMTLFDPSSSFVRSLFEACSKKWPFLRRKYEHGTNNTRTNTLANCKLPTSDIDQIQSKVCKCGLYESFYANGSQSCFIMIKYVLNLCAKDHFLITIIQRLIKIAR